MGGEKSNVTEKPQAVPEPGRGRPATLRGARRAGGSWRPWDGEGAALQAACAEPSGAAHPGRAGSRGRPLLRLSQSQALRQGFGCKEILGNPHGEVRRAARSPKGVFSTQPPGRGAAAPAAGPLPPPGGEKPPARLRSGASQAVDQGRGLCSLSRPSFLQFPNSICQCFETCVLALFLTTSGFE